jgi:hypothetical protein
MTMKKKLILLAVVVGLAYGAQWLWQSPYFALREIDRGISERDPVRVERYVDLEALVRAAVDVTAALAKEELGIGGTDLAGKLLGVLVGTVAQGVGDAASVQGAMEVRRAIHEGRMTKALGPFVLHDGWRALGGVEIFDKSALVSLNGACGGTEARVRVVFEEREGANFGYPKKWVLVGVDADSIKLLGKACRQR